MADRFVLAEAAIVLAVFVSLSLRAFDPPLSQTAISRLATVVALSEDGTWHIDRPVSMPANPFALRTIDKVEVEGRLISSKPPLLPLLMTFEYRALRGSFGWTLDNLSGAKRILYAMTFTLVILPWSLALVGVAFWLRRMGIQPRARIVTLLALAFGTQVYGFGAVFNNHVPAAALLLLCFAGVASIRDGGGKSPGLGLAAGLCGGLGAAFDLPNAIYVAAFGFLLLGTRRPATIAAFAIGAAIPVLAQAIILYDITGSPLPVQTHPEWYLYEASYWRNPLGVDALSEAKGLYLFNATVGNRGIFLLYPILLIGIAGLARAAVRPAAFRVETFACAVSFTLLTAYYVLNTDNYGGESYGMRWFIPSMPPLILMGLPALEGLRSRLGWAMVWGALAVSAVSAWHCGSAPWRAGREWLPGLLGL